MTELRTARLALHRPAPADVEAILAIHADPLACAHNPADALATLAEAEGLYRRWDAHWRRHDYGYWVLRRYHEAGPIGFCGLKAMRLHGRPVRNLFYRLAPAAWGQGLATEAVAAVLDQARAQGADPPVIARVRPANLASHRVAAAAGLRRAPHLDTGGPDGPDQIYQLPT
ncbi:GNAT family N-acetyltransferase [Crossiella sp. SN42]|uniref:GNAT family N-acetyltransferase n=1 Tax=Crossiella sp. SN42 TaxID=2944808 RepID=UPI00207C3485|nr:GNAT family N-acetyltransferase [Crossiella sp. SN42]MCO1577511.1 GNAT family N-acetyltransferase [Crossiella sp. SN42]